MMRFLTALFLSALTLSATTVQHLEQDLAKLPFGETRLEAVAAQEGKIVEKTASTVTMAKPEAAAAAASKITVQDVRASSVAFEQKIRQREFGFAKDVDAAAAAANEGRVTVTKATGENKLVLGGAFGDVRKANKGGEVHHTPADSVSQIPRDKGPSVWMEEADHRETGSCGRGLLQDAYRDQQKALIEQGNYRGALSKDFWDVRKNCGQKYDEGFRQAIEYAKTLPEFKKRVK